MVRSTRVVEIKLRAAEVIKNLWKAMNCHDSQLAKQTSDTGVNDNQTVVSTNSAFEEESAPAEKAKVVTKRRNAALTRQKKVNLNDLMGTSNAVWQSLCSMDTSVSMVLNKSITDLDSHADQCAEGSNALIVHDNDRPVVNVKCHNPDGPIYKDMQIVTGALAYNDSVAGKTVT
ncbi:hypothetical protein MHU86_4426 [Fragilaria crotonensis]|nr:hypothetical protein MHU86_4426 [Fragilaria crotonensis]